jgi:hypothetical protein
MGAGDVLPSKHYNLLRSGREYGQGEEVRAIWRAHYMMVFLPQA